MGPFSGWSGTLEAKKPLAPLTNLAVGGPAEYFAAPASHEELADLVRRCRQANVPWRVLGAGANVLIPDEGVPGLVVSLTAPAFRRIDVEGRSIRAGAGASLADVISAACLASLTGLEVLVGIPGSFGGAVRKNAGEKIGDIGQFVRSVELMDDQGNLFVRSRSEIRFGYRESNLDDAIILSATLELTTDQPDDINRRVKKAWITKRSHQPFGFQRSAYVFRNSRGLNADELIEKAGLRMAKVGAAELSDRDPRFVVTNLGATSRDVRRLIELVQTKVTEKTGVDLELQLDLW